MAPSIELSDDLLDEVQRCAADQGRTTASFVEDVLRVAVSRHGGRQARAFVVVPFAGDGVMPGVDLTDSAALLDLEDEGRDVNSLRQPPHHSVGRHP